MHDIKSVIVTSQVVYAGVERGGGSTPQCHDALESAMLKCSMLCNRRMPCTFVCTALHFRADNVGNCRSPENIKTLTLSLE